MMLLIAAFLALFRRIKNNFNNPELRALGVVTVVILLSGTVFFSIVEKFSYLDAFYFSVVTLTTIGYGDLVPKTDLGKLFTVVYVFLGIGILAAFVSVLAGRQKN